MPRLPKTPRPDITIEDNVCNTSYDNETFVFGEIKAFLSDNVFYLAYYDTRNENALSFDFHNSGWHVDGVTGEEAKILAKMNGFDKHEQELITGQ